ncbi:MAG: hypothetical protein PVJ57_17645 [Phycisphaerae bacterium]|jgi:hypothetical protein
MLPRFYLRDVQWSAADPVYGSKATIVRGRVATQENPGECDANWFVGPETAIVGSHIDAPEPTIVHYEVRVRPEDLAKIARSRLVVAARRPFAGLHSKVRDARVRISVNDTRIEYFGLKDDSPPHSDYFHRERAPLPLESIPLISDCHTIYHWSIPPRALERRTSQLIEFDLDPAVRWDIDYVTIITGTESRKLTPFGDRFLWQFLLLGLVVGIILIVISILLAKWIGTGG